MLITVVYEGPLAGGPSDVKGELVVRFHGADIENITDLADGTDAADIIHQKLPDVVINTYFTDYIGGSGNREFTRKSITLLDDGKRDLLRAARIQQRFVAELYDKEGLMLNRFGRLVLTHNGSRVLQYVHSCGPAVTQMLNQVNPSLSGSNLVDFALKSMTIDIRRSYE